MDINDINKFTEKITIENDDKYHVIIDNKIALLGQALVLGYNTPKECLKAFSSKIRWRLKSQLTHSDFDYNRASSVYIKTLQGMGRLKVMTLKEHRDSVLKNYNKEKQDF